MKMDDLEINDERGPHEMYEEKMEMSASSASCSAVNIFLCSTQLSEWPFIKAFSVSETDF